MALSLSLCGHVGYASCRVADQRPISTNRDTPPRNWHTNATHHAATRATDPADAHRSAVNPEHHDEIKRLLSDCTFDHIFDVRSEYYYENWRILGGEHHPFTGNGLHGFDPARIQSENITTVAFYCWTAPWQSEPAAIWFAQQYPDITVYDLKGLSYLDDIPGFCQFIDGNQAFIDQMTAMDNGPTCAAHETGTHECAEGTPEALALAMDPEIPADFTQGVGADQANEHVSEELRQAEAEFNLAHGVPADGLPAESVKPPAAPQASSSKDALEAEAEVAENSDLLVIVGAAAVCLTAMASAVAYRRYAAVSEVEAKVTPSLDGKSDDLEIEVVESPLEAVAVAVPESKTQTSEL